MTKPDPVGEWPIPRPKFTLGEKDTALLIVDMQEAQCRPDVGVGKLVAQDPRANEFFFGRIEAVIERQRKLLQLFRETGRRVIFVTIGPEASDGSDMAAWKRRRNEEMRKLQGVTYAGVADSTHGIVPALEPQAGEVVLNKITFGAFSSTGIDQILRNWGIGQLVICGQATNVCVNMTAVEAADRGFECVIPGDACAAWNETLHEVFLDNFGLLFGKVKDTADVIEELAGADRAEAVVA
jgi:nicotinamidase-related amidase